MNRREDFDGFQLYNNAALHQQIHAKPLIEVHPVKVEGNGSLPFHSEPTFLQCSRKNRFINRFQQPRTKIPMEMERGIHDRS